MDEKIKADFSSPQDWLKEIHLLLFAEGGRTPLLALAEQALLAFPSNAELLNVASLAALLAEKPGRSLSLQKRMRKRYVPEQQDFLYEGLALAQQGRWLQARHILKQHGLDSPHRARYTPYGSVLYKWFERQIKTIHAKTDSAAKKVAQNRRHTPAPRKVAKRERVSALPATAVQSEIPFDATEVMSTWEDRFPELPGYESNIPIRFDLNLKDITQPRFLASSNDDDVQWFQLRGEFAHLNLLQGFDELLCLSQLHNVDTYWYQLETVRKVLKQFRGRVLLADEVGLGKTVEAGMVLKEYLLRGMVERVLILTPASLVGQWCEEMESKFSLDFASSYDSLLRRDPGRFWAQPKVIASIAVARREEHFERLKRQQYDLVIIDEAHHLKNRGTRNWKLVDGLQKRFLILLSATPVQNSLVELYNLLTLLKPGIFRTEKEFRSAYMTPGKPRVPANRQRMHELMRDVMIRNTRSLVDVRLPARHAVTLRLDPGSEEASCYEELSRRLRQSHEQGNRQQSMALRHLLSAAGSSPASAAAAIERFATRREEMPDWRPLLQRYRTLGNGVKESTLIELLKKNPTEKKMVFIHHRETLEHLDGLLQGNGIEFARFDGTMRGPEKDLAIEQFRAVVPVLLCTETGGEGRNVQFCNTLINFDLPWNPMLIEQRIGRIHRIGQQREVFIFNLAVRGTLEDQLLIILDEKINMFELVVGEIGAILGEMDDDQDFVDLVFNAWLNTAGQNTDGTFDILGQRIEAAKTQYDAIKVLDEKLFGEEFEAA